MVLVSCDTRVGGVVASHTLADVDDKGAGDGRCVDPFTREVLDLETRMGGSLEELQRGSGVNHSESLEIAYECEEAGVIVRTDALISERPIVGWVLDDLEVRLSARHNSTSSQSHLASVLHQRICIVEFVERIRRETKRFRK